MADVDEGLRSIRAVRRSNVCDYIWNVVPKSYKLVAFTAKCSIRHYADCASLVRGFLRSFVRAEGVRYVAYCMENGPVVGWHVHGIFFVQGAVPRGTVEKCFLRVFYHQQLSRRLTPLPLVRDPDRLYRGRRSLPTPLKWISYIVKHGPCFTMTQRVLRKATPYTQAVNLLAQDDTGDPTQDATVGEALL